MLTGHVSGPSHGVSNQPIIASGVEPSTLVAVESILTFLLPHFLSIHPSPDCVGLGISFMKATVTRCWRNCSYARSLMIYLIPCSWLPAPRSGLASHLPSQWVFVDDVYSSLVAVSLDALDTQIGSCGAGLEGDDVHSGIPQGSVDISNQHCGLNAVVQGIAYFYWKAAEYRANKASAKAAWCDCYLSSGISRMTHTLYARSTS